MCNFVGHEIGTSWLCLSDRFCDPFSTATGVIRVVWVFIGDNGWHLCWSRGLPEPGAGNDSVACIPACTRGEPQPVDLQPGHGSLCAGISPIMNFAQVDNSVVPHVDPCLSLHSAQLVHSDHPMTSSHLNLWLPDMHKLHDEGSLHNYHCVLFDSIICISENIFMKFT